MATGIHSNNTRIYATSLPAVTLTDEAMTDAGDHQHYSITNQVKRILDPNTAVVAQVAHDEIQTVTVTGTPTGGTFTLTFNGQTTGTIAFNALASAVQTALQGLSSVGANNALVSGSAGGPYTVRFTATLGQADQPQMTASGAGLTGGTSPDVTPATVQAGSGFTTASSGFTLYLVGARVVFAVAQAAGTAVRLHSGKYLPYLAIAGANSAEFAGQLNTQETTDFADGGFKSFTPLTLEGTLKAHCWWHNSAIIQKLTSRELVAISFLDDAGERHEGFCWVSDSDLKTATKGVVEADYTFMLTDQFFVN